MSVNDKQPCPLCAYRPVSDKATKEEHSAACHRGKHVLDYTANPNCEGRTWHHHETWCDVCKGVA